MLLSLAAMSAGAAAGQAEPPRAAYRQVTGTRLRGLVVGRMFTLAQPEGVMSAPLCHRFHPGGRYEECGDRRPFYDGRYRLTGGGICATGGPHSGCWRLFEGYRGEYWLWGDGGRRTRVCISPMDQPPPRCP